MITTSHLLRKYIAPDITAMLFALGNTVQVPNRNYRKEAALSARGKTALMSG